MDWCKDRLYIPLEDVERFGYTERDLDASAADDRFRELMAFEVKRTRELFEAGRPLLDEATQNLRLELHLTWYGGMTILKKIEAIGYDVLHRRPVVSLWDKISILGTSLLMSR